ncbi:Translation_protein [Hexamita inflata]|uniref:Beta-barrel domain superfamily n=1 Tax=Hexamita inflata TaxID=28002 RepID=A0ABP1K126_9EUKA
MQVRISKGVLHLNQPITLVNGKQGGQQLGTVFTIYDKGQDIYLKSAKAGEEVTLVLKLNRNNEITDVGAVIVTQLTRKSIELLQTHFQDELILDWVHAIKDIEDFIYIQ